MRRLLGLFIVAALFVAGFASIAHAQKLVMLKTRPGVTQSIFVADMGIQRAGAIVILFPGGGGHIKLREEGGQPRFDGGNFLVRTRLEFIRNGLQPVIVDAPSDQQAGEGMSDAFRAGAEHATDMRAVIDYAKRRFPGLPVFLIGTSRGTVSTAHLGRSLAAEIKGVVSTSSMMRIGPQRVPFLSVYDWRSIAVPLLFVHHRDDACRLTAYGDVAPLGQSYALITVKGGKPPESGPCDPFAPHGFFGVEAKTVDAIANWIFGRAFAKEVG